ncbi:MAG: GreA/GreB family elongation factor [Verrucomicrobiota bacterium]
MREEFEKLVAAGKISKHHLGPLLLLAEGGYCMHRSWGFGKITMVDTVLARFSIDFTTKAGHQMDLAFAADSLKPISRDHILARKASDLNSVKQMAALHHLDLIKLVLMSYGGRATLEQIQQVLVPDVIASDWKKWWEVAKRELKKDGHFQVPTKKTDPIVYQPQETSLQKRLMDDFRAAKGLKARIAAATEIQKNLPDLDEKAAILPEVFNTLNVEINSHQRTQPGLALEAIFLRDELREAGGPAAAEGELTATSLWSQVPKLPLVLEQVPAAKHKRVLLSFKDANPEQWQTALVSMMNNASAKLCGECAQVLIQGGRMADLKDTLAKLISQHQASSELLLWLAKERSDTYADILGPEVFRAMLTAIERDQFNEKRSNRLRDHVMDDHELLIDLIGSADIEVIKDVTRALQLSPSFDDMDKRSLLARIVKSFPTIQSLITGDQPKQEAALVVSWESLERRKVEYTDLVQKKIPANSKEIAVARSYGDLRENHEYKAAKEMQKLLMKQKGKLESDLARARGTDFANVRSDVVSIGSKVTVTDLSNQHSETYSILGAWDYDAEHSIISYLTPMAQALLNHKVGDEVDFELEGTKRHYRIDAIAAARPAQSGATVTSAPGGTETGTNSSETVPQSTPQA